MAYLELTPERTLVTATELYALSDSPRFVRQTGTNENGEYSMVWSINDKEYQTNNIL